MEDPSSDQTDDLQMFSSEVKTRFGCLHCHSSIDSHYSPWCYTWPTNPWPKVWRMWRIDTSKIVCMAIIQLISINIVVCFPRFGWLIWNELKLKYCLIPSFPKSQILTFLTIGQRTLGGKKREGDIKVHH